MLTKYYIFTTVYYTISWLLYVKLLWIEYIEGDN